MLAVCCNVLVLRIILIPDESPPRRMFQHALCVCVGGGGMFLYLPGDQIFPQGQEYVRGLTLFDIFGGCFLFYYKFYLRVHQLVN